MQFKEREWKCFLENGKAAKSALVSSNTIRVPTGVDIFYQVYVIRYA
jgi:hypothetical protein